MTTTRPARTSSVLFILSSIVLFVACSREKESVPPQGVMDDLIAGHVRFLENDAHDRTNLHDLVASTADAQQPKAVVITCSDSRLVPEIIFDQSIGDLFVIRNAGNIVDGELELGSLQFAVEHLGVRNVIVMGHERCGAITALMSGSSSATGHLAHVLQHLAEETEERDIMEHREDHPDAVHDGVLANILHGMRALHDMELVRANGVEVHGFSYDQATGELRIVELPNDQDER
jgi:carbonic anhydrase